MDLNYKYDGTDDHMDSRTIEEDIQSIEQEFELDYEEYQGPGDFAAHIRKTDPEVADIYEAIYGLRDEAASANEGWEYGIQFVREGAADGEWAKERAASLGYIKVGGMHEGGTYWERIEEVTSRWPYTHIDWDAAADDLHSDAVEFTFRGETYFED